MPEQDWPPFVARPANMHLDAAGMHSHGGSHFQDLFTHLAQAPALMRDVLHQHSQAVYELVGQYRVAAKPAHKGDCFSIQCRQGRLAKLHLTIRSLLIQSVQPEKILLWLHHDLASQIPAALKDLQGDIFEIHYVDLTCSHRKLIHSLTAFPHKVIVTCDDDLMYNSSWLERLYLEHQKFPLDVIAHECRRITRDEQGELLPYKEWPTLNEPGIAGMDLLAIGYGGVLYPPG